MNKYRDETFKNPLIYIFIIFILSSLSYEIYSTNKVLAIFIVVSFFIMSFIFKGSYITIVLAGAYTVSILNNIWFYDYKPNSQIEVRIIDKGFYYGKGEAAGRNINLIGIDESLEVGDKIIANGEFTQNLNISKGVIGDYKINNYIIQKSDLISKLYRRRESVFKRIEEKLGSRKAGFITSVAFGYKEYLDDDYSDIMKGLGISHIMAVSGLHLALIYGILLKLCNVKIALIISFIYVIFTGASPSSVRAYIMIFIMSFGVVVKRTYNPMSALSLAGILILLVKPYDIYTLGFLLSFLATLGIITFNETFNRILYKLPGNIREVIAVSLSAQVFSIPILILSFNEISINFLFGNIILIPLINIIVILGNVLILVEKFSGLFNYCLYLCHYVIKYIDEIMYKLDGIAFNMVYLHYTVAYFYIALLITYYFYRKGFKKFIFYPIIMGLYIAILIYSPLPTIRYYKEGGLLLSYKGERVLFITKEMVSYEKLKIKSLSKNIIEDFKQIKIKDNTTIKKSGKNYILLTGENKYMLLVNYEKINNEYDIIDFRKGNIQEVIIFKDEVINSQ